MRQMHTILRRRSPDGPPDPIGALRVVIWRGGRAQRVAQAYAYGQAAPDTLPAVLRHRGHGQAHATRDMGFRGTISAKCSGLDESCLPMRAAATVSRPLRRAGMRRAWTSRVRWAEAAGGEL